MPPRKRTQTVIQAVAVSVSLCCGCGDVVVTLDAKVPMNATIGDSYYAVSIEYPVCRN